jgi:LysM repeat protein/ABC-type branched-subunit amino acid transport system substrate-binding protein
MLKKVICVFVFAFTISVFGQNFLKHTVVSGETITQIAQKYFVTPADIYQLNPDCQTGIHPNSILLIPAKSHSNSKTKTHQVAPKETIYSIAKAYDISVADLEKANGDALKLGLKIGQTIVIPTKNAVIKTPINPEKTIFHEVQPKETKYGIATKYGISVEQLEKQNPEIVESLPVGFQLLISGKASKTIDIPKKNSNSVSNVAFSKKTISNLVATKSVQKKKELVLLLPFNISKIESDTINSVASKLKTDKFLNMTLDFYSGALVAIDSARTLGLNVNIKILDSQETKTTSNVSNLFAQNNLENSDAIIGPFYQANIEKMADLVSKNNIPVLSPLSKEIGKPYSNLYQSMPSNDAMKNAVFDYMRSKDGNIVAVIDAKKTAVKQYISENQKGVRFVGLNDKNTIVQDSLRKVFSKNKMNFVILDSQKTGMILTTTNALIALMADFQIQLVILEPNSTLDFEEIDLTRLTKLKLLYPSITRENETPEASLFEMAYKNKNKIFPNQYATRGFDITFDTILRLSQEKTFQETSIISATEQIENKFDYFKTANGFVNRGVFILYYDVDLTIKVAN